jgi:L-amino acid N-acyltransferase YncA
MKGFLKNIQKYGLKQHLSYLSNYDRVNVYVQADLLHLPVFADISPLQVRNMVINEPNDIESWTDVINDAYEEFGESKISVENAKNYLANHLFMNVKGVVLIVDNDLVIGATTYGTYIENPKIGCVSRIAIRSSYKGKGLGKYIITKAYMNLRENGIRYGQSIINVKRKASIITHFKCGFVPQFDSRHKIFKNQQRFYYINLRVNSEISSLYNNYLQDLFCNFKNT